jgi:crotonobetainyl-CoA:carnitine CoA-transferase CaiB-like acyl-CoA transferase
MMRVLDPLAAEYRFSGTPRPRTGSRAGYTAPSNVYRTSDGAWITLVGSSDAIFMRLCRAIGRPELAKDERFDTNVHRTQNLMAIDTIVADWCAGLSLAEVSALLDREEVPFSKVYSIADVVEDPHFRERNAFIELQDPELGAIPAPAPVPRFVGRSAAVPKVGPRTGEDNEAVYGAIGVSREELDRLRAKKVI